MSAPRLFFVAPALGSNDGWVTSQAEILAERFARDGFTVMISSRHLGRLRRLLDVLMSTFRLRRSYDVAVVAVFSWKAFLNAELTSWLLNRVNKPFVFVLHGGDLPRFSRRFPKWTARVLQRADVVLAPSAYLSSELDHLGIDIRVIPNMIELDDYPFAPRAPARPRLLWMRTFHELYHPEMAVEVVAELEKRGTHVHLTMGGQDRGLRSIVERRAATLGVSDRVSLVGFLDGDGKREALQTHDVFLNTNRVDNMPVSVVEAGAAGLIVVATAVGGIPYLLVHEESALMVADGDVDAMADAVERVLEDEALASQLSNGARRVAERSGWPTVRAQLIDVFSEATKSR